MTRSGVQGVILEKPPKKIPTYQLYSKQFSFCSNEYRLHAKLMQSSEVTCDTLHLDECTLQALLQASCLCLLFLLKESVQERSRKDEPDETSWLSNLLIFFWTSFKWISLLKFLGYPVLSFLPRTTLLVYLLGAASLERPPERPLPRLSNPCTYTYREWDATRSQKICSFKHFFDYFLFFHLLIIYERSKFLGDVLFLVC